MIRCRGSERGIPPLLLLVLACWAGLGIEGNTPGWGVASRIPCHSGNSSESGPCYRANSPSLCAPGSSPYYSHGSCSKPAPFKTVQHTVVIWHGNSLHAAWVHGLRRSKSEEDPWRNNDHRFEQHLNLTGQACPAAFKDDLHSSKLFSEAPRKQSTVLSDQEQRSCQPSPCQQGSRGTAWSTVGTVKEAPSWAETMAENSNQQGVGKVQQEHTRHPWSGVGMTRSVAGTTKAKLRDTSITAHAAACTMAARVRVMDLLQGRNTTAAIHQSIAGCKITAVYPRDALVRGLNPSEIARSAECELPVRACLLAHVQYAFTKHTQEARCCFAKMQKGTSPRLQGKCLDPAIQYMPEGTKQVGTFPVGATAERSRGTQAEGCQNIAMLNRQNTAITTSTMKGLCVLALAAASLAVGYLSVLTDTSPVTALARQHLPATETPKLTPITKIKSKQKRRQKKARSNPFGLEEFEQWLGREKHHVKLARARQLKREWQRFRGRLERNRRLALYTNNKRWLRRRPTTMPEAPACTVPQAPSQAQPVCNAPKNYNKHPMCGSIDNVIGPLTRQGKAELALEPNVALNPGPLATDYAMTQDESPSTGDSCQEARPEVLQQGSNRHEQRGGGPKKMPVRKRGGAILARRLELAVPGLADSSSPHPRQTWALPREKQLYCEPQREGCCGIHTLNAMAGKQALTPAQAMEALQQQLPRSADEGRDCAPGGWFRIESICKMLYYFTQEDVTLALVVQNAAYTAPQPPRYAKWEVLQNHAPAGCTALFLHKPDGPGHFICWRQSPEDGKWYELIPSPMVRDSTGDMLRS